MYNKYTANGSCFGHCSLTWAWALINLFFYWVLNMYLSIHTMFPKCSPCLPKVCIKACWKMTSIYKNKHILGEWWDNMNEVRIKVCLLLSTLGKW